MPWGNGGIVGVILGGIFGSPWGNGWHNGCGIACTSASDARHGVTAAMAPRYGPSWSVKSRNKRTRQSRWMLRFRRLDYSY